MCTYDDCIIAKMYKLLLKYESEEELVKNCIVKWVKIYVYDIQMEEWERIWLRGLKFTLVFSLENIYKNIFHWHMSPDKLAKIYKNILNKYGNVSSLKGLFTIWIWKKNLVFFPFSCFLFPYFLLWLLSICLKNSQ